MKHLSVSVGVMVYNEEGNIGNLLRSLLCQKMARFVIDEIIVVASGCTDATTNVVGTMCQELPHIKLVVEDQRCGKATAVNLFLQHARNDYLVVTGGDLIAHHQAIENLLIPLLMPRVGMSGAHPIPINDSHTFLGRVLHLMWQLHHTIALEQPKLGEMIGLRRVFDQIPRQTAVDEVSMEALVRRRGYRLAYVPEAIVYNKGPTILSEFFQQRRRIFAGHLRTRREQGYSVATLSPGRIFRHLVRLCLKSPANIFPAAFAIILEAFGRLAGLCDVFLGRNHTVWKPLTSTKTLDNCGQAILGHRSEPGLKVTRIDKLEDFLKLEACWNLLLERNETNSVYMTFEWVATWWRHFHKGRKLLVLLVKESGRIIAIAPLMITTQRFCGMRIRMVKFIGTGRVFGIGLGLAGLGDFICAERRHDAVQACIEYIHRHADLWDLLDFRYVSSASSTTRLLHDFANHYRWKISRQVCTVTPYLKLHDTWATYLGDKSKNFRKKLRKAERKAAEAGTVKIVKYNRTASVSELLDIVAEIDKESWQAQRGVPVYATNRQQLFFTTFMTTALQKSWPEMWVLKIADIPVAYEFGFLYNCQFSAEFSAYKQQYAQCSPGHLLTASIIKDLFDRKMKAYDFGMELFPYKARWASSLEEDMQIVIFKNTFRSKIIYVVKYKLKWLLKKYDFIMTTHRNMLGILNRLGFLKKMTSALF